MDKRLRINIGLLAFIVLLTVVLLYTGEETDPEPVYISEINRDGINRIEVIRKGLDDFVFNKQGDTWFMQSPLEFTANNARINAMLRILTAESFGQLNPAEVELSRFELDDPLIKIKLNEHEFIFGNTDAIDQRRYVLFNDTIHLTNDSLYKQLTTNAAFFADTKLLPVNIKIASIQYPDNKMELIDGTWQLTRLMDIHPDQFKRIAFNWTNALAISVSKYAEPESRSTISVTDSNNNVIEFVIIATDPNLILGREDLGIQYHMGSDEAEKLLLVEKHKPDSPG